jgi:hypothetical protein
MNLSAFTVLRRFLFFLSLLLRALLFSIKYRDLAFKVGIPHMLHSLRKLDALLVVSVTLLCV